MSRLSGCCYSDILTTLLSTVSGWPGGASGADWAPEVTSRGTNAESESVQQTFNLNNDGLSF